MTRRYILIVAAVIILVLGLTLFVAMNLAMTAGVGAAQDEGIPIPTMTPHPATDEEYAEAFAEWSKSAHADTYDGGQGANTTCARCKNAVFPWCSAIAAPRAFRHRCFRPDIRRYAAWPVRRC